MGLFHQEHEHRHGVFPFHDEKGWLNTPYVVPHDKIRKIMVIIECIFSISKDVFTPILYWSCCAVVPQFRIQATYRNTVLPWMLCFLWRSQAVFNQHCNPISTGISLVFGLLKGTQAVNEEALSSSCTDLSCDIFIFV
jgi:hypothetical protein